jgi:NAD(P)-dependent dehydrogenase (short-subunit alcohol dehydrogenase family)
VPGFFDSFLPYFPLGRLVTVDDIAAAAVWLCSDECFMTGSTLAIDGGMSLRGVPLIGEIAKATT